MATRKKDLLDLDGYKTCMAQNLEKMLSSHPTPTPWYESSNTLREIRKESSKISVWCIYSFKNIVTESESNFSKTTLGYIWEAFIEDFV